MNRIYLSVLTTLLSILAHAQPIPPGKTDTVYSMTLGESRRIHIYLPSGYGDTWFYPRRYPVLYLLDGDTHLRSISAMIQLLSEGRGPLDFPELIVVAIPNTDRMRDLSPTRPTHQPRMDSASLSRTGGGEKFLSFISNELMPHIDSTYRTAPYKIFMGHSLGGLTVVHTFLHHTSMFNAYIATDPSMSWDDQKLLRQAKDILKENKFAGRSLFLAIANNTPPGLDTLTIRSDSNNEFSRHMTSIFSLRNTLAAAYPQPPYPFKPFSGQPPVPENLPPAGPAPFRFSWKYYPDCDHGSLPLPAEYDALRFTFNYYSLYFPFPELFQPSWTQDTLLTTHYKVISRYMGYKVLPPETLVNNIGYNLMGSRQFDRAAYYFQLNIENFPNSFNVYDSMGDLLAAQQQKDSAIKCYQKALTLREEPGIRQKMEKLSR
jgi:predicted alpha/beta superfamily hydrolase